MRLNWFVKVESQGLLKDSQHESGFGFRNGTKCGEEGMEARRKLFS